MSGELGSIGVGLEAVGGIGAGIVPGAELLAFGGGLLASLDPSDEELIVNPLPRDPYARTEPLWGVPMHPDDIDRELEALGVGAGQGIGGDQGFEGSPKRIRFELERRGTLQALTGPTQTGAHPAVLVAFGRPDQGPAIDGLPAFPSEHGPRAWKRTIWERTPRRKTAWEREILSVASVAALLERMFAQVEAHAGKPPVFRGLELQTLEQFRWSFFHDRARFDSAGRIVLPKPSSDGVIRDDHETAPVKDFADWRKEYGKRDAFRVHWERSSLELEAAYAAELEAWQSWQLEVAQQRARAELEAAAAAKVGAAFQAVLSGELEAAALGLSQAELVALKLVPDGQPPPPPMLPPDALTDLASRAPTPAPAPTSSALVAGAGLLAALLLL